MSSTTLAIEIKPVTPPDVPAIAALAREIWQATYPGIITQEQIDFMLEQRYGHERLYDDLEDADKWLDQAFVAGRRIGFAFSELYKGEFKLDKLYIHPDLQRQGVGGALIAHVAARAKKLGYPCVILAVNKRNEKAIASYRKYGFSVRETVVADIGGGFVMDDFIMEKPL
ncbi:GNAT family N-acetyltransferase [Azovibrio restrictus]|uniref:GNAT family N-acetyltransferase n=1 Tax=Azovibrio restrictus TaxID=146938 RepID=UPI000407DBD7|nr:GNAT family N-acetyltransferase [Azovibrio restrictus]MCE1169803.1 GNAT family N-acetyltransferase [Azovibrio sp.]MDD3482116.1 GNAT family N-acetyltransferase [Azovibrio restrictus]